MKNRKLFVLVGAVGMLLAACNSAPVSSAVVSSAQSSVASSAASSIASSAVVSSASSISSAVVSSSSIAKKFTVKFMADGVEVASKSVVENDFVTLPSDPKKEGYIFLGWFTDAECTQKFNQLATLITTDITLYAGWEREVPPTYPVLTHNQDFTTITFGYKGEEETVTLGEKDIYLDAYLTDAEIEGKANVFNDFKKAISACVSGTEQAPMNLYIAPGVYWIHDPASASTTEAYGMTWNIAHLHMRGLTPDARNVVIAGNYGHDEGFAGGNWTMFNASGDGLQIRDMTIGDFCNVDLDFPLDPTKEVAKRTTNITQGQIANYNGDKLYCDNVRFISRLNMMPFISSKRALYVNCHMESTDDSLNGSSKAVYLNCDLHFYASKPWGGSSGVTLLNSDLYINHINYGETVTQYLSKGAGRFNVIDCRYHSDYPESTKVNLGFSDILSNTFRSYYSNVTLNGEPADLSDGGKNPRAAVDITGTDFLKAYKLTKADGSVVYNTYNLLRGSDEWDPLGVKADVEAAQASDVATGLSVTSTKNSIETGAEDGDEATLSFNVSGPQRTTDYKTGVTATFSIPKEDEDVVTLTPANDGLTCLVKAKNETEEARTVVVDVKTNTGLAAAISINVKPSVLPAPEFQGEKSIVQNNDGTAQVNYALDLGQRADMSRVSWYLADSASDESPILIAESRHDTPLKKITLNKGYIGKYLIAKIEPKHIRSSYGEAATVISSTPITAEGIQDQASYKVDIEHFATAAQSKVAPGLWTLDGYKPLDTEPNYIPLDATEKNEQFKATNFTPNANSWNWAKGNRNGFLDYEGIYTTSRGGRLRYTPVGDSFGDMDVKLELAPGKTAGQGFGSANQYLDVMIKYDTTNLTGYGIRIFRKTGDSTCVCLVKYVEGKSKLLNTPVETSCFLTKCSIHLWTEGGLLKGTVNSSQEQSKTAQEKGYAASVSLQAEIDANTYGGFCFINTSTVGDNTTYIGSIDMNWAAPSA